MKFNIPKIVSPLLLTDYAPQMVNEQGKPLIVYVWVNPPRDVMKAFFENQDAIKALSDELKQLQETPPLNAECVTQLAEQMQQLAEQAATWFAQLWSQYPDPDTHWTPEEIAQLVGHETDPGLYPFLSQRSIVMIHQHRGNERKK